MSPKKPKRSTQRGGKPRLDPIEEWKAVSCGIAFDMGRLSGEQERPRGPRLGIGDPIFNASEAEWLRAWVDWEDKHGTMPPIGGAGLALKAKNMDCGLAFDAGRRIGQLERLTSAAQLFEVLQHGDEAHRAWLRQALEDYFAGRPVVRLGAEPMPDYGTRIERLK